MTFGQAQKIVNMAFKYLFCLAKDEKIRQKFDVCHMPLDGIMLEWIFRNCKNVDGTVLLKKHKGAWSKMNKGSDEEQIDNEVYYTYEFYRKILLYSFPDTPLLQLDFENWREMSLVMAVEAYLKNFKEEERKEGLPLKIIEKKIQDAYTATD